MVLGPDSRVLTLAFARMADALGNSFLIIVPPLYIASGEISLSGIAGTELVGFVLQEETLIGVVLSLLGLVNSFGQPFTGRWSDRVGERRAFVLGGLVLFGIGAAFTVPATVALINDYAESDSERGGNFGVYNTLRLVGFGFGPIIAGIVVTGGLSKMFDIQTNKFKVVSCLNCGYSELYRQGGKAGSDIVDVFLG